MVEETGEVSEELLGCPEQMCDGSGELSDGRICLCVTNTDEDEYDPDRDY